MLRRLWDLLSCSSTSVKDDEVPGAHEKFEPPAPQISDLSAAPSKKREATDDVLSSEHLIAASKFAHECYPGTKERWSPIAFTPSKHESDAGATWRFFAFPGTCNTSDIAIDADVSLVYLNSKAPFKDCSDEDGKAHKGFLNRYDGIAQSEAYREALEAAEKSKPAALIFTGHSLGGAVAMLAALDFKLRQSREERKKDVAKVFCVTFGAPLVADAAVVELVKDRLWTQDFLHIVSRHDLVPRILIAKMQGLSILLQSAFSRASQEALIAAKEAGGEVIAKKMEALPEAKDAWQRLWDRIRVVCKNLRKTTGHIIIGLADSELSNYRPFGEFVVFTSTGFARFEDQVEVLQMLAKTMCRTTAPRISSFDALKEHSMAGYVRAVRKINLEEPRWHRVEAWVADTKTMYELGMLAAQKDLLSMMDIVERELDDVAVDVRSVRTLQEEMLVEIRRWGAKNREGDANVDDPVPAVRSTGKQSIAEAQQLKEDETRLAQKYRELSVVTTALTDLLHDERNWEIYRLAGLPETRAALTEADKNVAERLDSCRWQLGEFWDEVIEKYADGLLAADLFAPDRKWLQWADGHRKLVEPVDIANFYRRELWKGHPVGEAQYLESDNRPKRYVLIERLWVEGHRPDYTFEDSTKLAVERARAIQAVEAC